MKKMYKVFIRSFKHFELSFLTRYFFILIPFRILRVIRTGSLSVVDSFLSDKLFKIKGLNLKFRQKDFPLIREILLLNNYRYDYKSQYDIVVDLGSNCGVFSFLASKNAKYVYGVELDKNIINEYKYLKQINNIKNCITINKAIGSVNTENSITMNDFIIENRISHIDFIKIDIEGAEEQIFINGDTSWLNIVSIASIEVHPCFNIDVNRIMQTLTSYGFTVQLCDRNNVSVDLLTDPFGFIYASR